VEKRRIDLTVGLMASVILHTAVLAAASGMLLPRNTAQLSADPRPSLEVLVVPEQDWRAQLEESQPMRIAQPIETPSIHQPAEPLAWPELDVARPREQALTLRVPFTSPSIDTPPPVTERTRELVQPDPLLEEMHEPLPPEPVAAVEAAAPVQIESTSSIVLYRPELRYPPRPLRRGIEGIARVGIEVGASGNVSRVWLMKSSGNRELDRAALENLNGWRFDPAAIAAMGLGWAFRNDVRFVID